MKVTLELSGLMNRLAICSLSRDFVRRIFVHCMGKNNTPYFTNNCFKGVLYFDAETARNIAASSGVSWNGWLNADAFYRFAGYSLESSLEIRLLYADSTGKDRQEMVPPTLLSTAPKRIALDKMLPEIGADQVVILLGTVDKGTETYSAVLPDGMPDLEKFEFSVDTFEDFSLEERLITGIRYDDCEFERVHGESRGRNAIMPVLFAPDGEELDLYDFIG